MIDASFVKELERLATGGQAPKLMYEDLEERVYLIPGQAEPLRIRKYVSPPALVLRSAVDLVEALARHVGVKPENLLDSRVHEREATSKLATIFVDPGQVKAVLDALGCGRLHYSWPLFETRAWKALDKLLHTSSAPRDLVMLLQQELHGTYDVGFLVACKSIKWDRRESGSESHDASSAAMSREAMRELVTKDGQKLPEEVTFRVPIYDDVDYVAEIPCFVSVNLDTLRIVIRPRGQAIEQAAREVHLKIQATLVTALQSSGLADDVRVLRGSLAADCVNEEGDQD